MPAKTLDQLLRSLGRDEVEEVTLVAGRLPCARVGTSFDPIDDAPVSPDAILAMLVAAGGSRYVDTLAPDAKQWRVRAPGLGVISVSALQRGQHVEARFSLEGRPVKPAAPERRSSKPPSVRHASLGRQEAQRAKRRTSDRATRVTSPEVKRQGRGRSMSMPAQRVAVTAPEPEASPPSSAGAFLAAILERARASSASDLHLVAGRRPLLRVGGELRADGDPILPDALERELRGVVPARLLPVLEDLGSCDFAMDRGALGRFRVNVSRQQTGWKASLRLVPRELPTLRSLGLPSEITRASGHHQGLVVFTGPTGHGKTTSMTAVVDHINHTTTHHVITVEDPVENLHPKKRALMSQREVGAHTKTFASALRAALREDPDVIVVGELRDTETVSMAVAASETGHLVLGTMNTPSAAKTIDRLIDLFPPADQPQVRLTLATGLRLIVGQRLVPNLDRTAVHAAIELLPGSLALSALIRDNKTFQIPSLQQRGKGVGILRMDESLLDLVRRRSVAVDDARAFAESPAEFDANLQKLASSVRIP